MNNSNLVDRNPDLAELRPKVFKVISAYRHMNFNNDKMIAKITNDLLRVFIKEKEWRIV